MSRRRIVAIVVLGFLALAVGAVALHDLVLFDHGGMPGIDYCQVSVESAADRGLDPGVLTTSEATSGCQAGERHFCEYPRIVLGNVMREREDPCW